MNWSTTIAAKKMKKNPSSPDSDHDGKSRAHADRKTPEHETGGGGPGDLRRWPGMTLAAQ
jgi:hypothetical protein